MPTVVTNLARWCEQSKQSKQLVDTFVDNMGPAAIGCWGAGYSNMGVVRISFPPPVVRSSRSTQQHQTLPRASEFRRVGGGQPWFYRLHVSKGSTALNPHSRAPKTPARVYEQDPAEAVLKIRRRLTGKEWDAGPQSVWHADIATTCFPPEPPCVPPLARILADARGRWTRIRASVPASRSSGSNRRRDADVSTATAP